VIRCTHINLHVLKLINAAFGVALANFAKRFVFVTALAHIFSVDFVHHSLLGLVARLSEILLQCLSKKIFHYSNVYIEFLAKFASNLKNVNFRK